MLFKILSSYTCSLYYFKGKDMILSDFLSRMEGDKNDPHEVTSKSFNSDSILTEHYYTFFTLLSGTYGKVIRSQRKTVGTQMLKAHGVDKVVDPALMPETQARRAEIPKPMQVEPKFSVT